MPQIVYISEEIQIIKRDQTNSGVKNYNNWNEEFTKNFNIRLQQAELKTREVENRSFKIIQFEEHKDEGVNKNEESLGDLWDTIKHTTYR